MLTCQGPCVYTPALGDIQEYDIDLYVLKYHHVIHLKCVTYASLRGVCALFILCILSHALHHLK